MKHLLYRPSTYVILFFSIIVTILLSNQNIYGSLTAIIVGALVSSYLITEEKETEQRNRQKRELEIYHHQQNKGDWVTLRPWNSPPPRNKDSEINLSNGNIEMKLTQRDLVDYVISKEVERVNAEIGKVNLEVREIEDFLQKERDKRYESILAAAKTHCKDFVNLFKDAVFSTEVFGFNETRINLDSYRRHIRDNDHRPYNYVFQKKELLNGTNNLLIAKKDDIMLGTMMYKLTESEVESIFKLYEDAEKTRIEKRDLLDTLYSELHQIRCNSEKVMNKLIEQHLESSPEGLKMLEKLSAIKLTTTKKELK